MVLDAPGLHHARGGDDDAGPVVGVESFGIVYVAHVGELVKAEGILGALDEGADVLVEVLVMQPVDVGGGQCQWTVHEALDVGQVAGAFQPVQGIDDLLRPADGEGGDQQLASAFGAGVLDNHHQLLLGLFQGGVQPVAVGGLGDDVVGIREGHGVGEYLLVVATYIAGVAQGARLVTLFAGDVDGRTT